MITMEMLGKVRRLYSRDQKSLHEIAKTTGLSRNTIRKWVRDAGEVAKPTYRRIEMPCKLTAFAQSLELALNADAQRTKQNRRTAKALHLWMTEQRKRVPKGSATAKAIDYSLGRWQALTRYIDDGELPADNNWVENQIRPIAIGRSNWLFAGSLRAGKRAAAVMSLVHSARLNGHDPYAYLKDILERLPTQRASRVDDLLPHRWQPSIATT